MLQVSGIHAGYGASRVLQEVSLNVAKGSLTTVLGANGAGKSTLLRAISGVVRTRKGSVTLEGERIDALEPYQIVRRGVVHVPEGRQIFPELSVAEHLQLGSQVSGRQGKRHELREFVFGLFPRLEQRLRQSAGTLSGGEQQMLAIGRALMAEPQLLLLDEPSMGLSPILVEQVLDVVRQLNSQRGLTVLLVEQNTRVAMSLASIVYVLENGRIAFTGSPAEAQASTVIQDLYLGRRDNGE
jgi:branched-chain amino acid transport system ATP-binding protein